MQHKAIKYKDFINLVDYDTILDYKTAIDFIDIYNIENDIFNFGELTELQFGFIKDVQTDFIHKELTYDLFISYIETVKNLTKEQIYNYYLHEICQYINWFTKQIKNILEFEQLNLATNIPINPILARSGIEMFDKFEVYNQIRDLAGGDITKIEQVRKLKYSDCLIELLYRKDLYIFEHNKSKILESEQKKK